jgi:DNA-binding transcriptional LysR family regulator
MDRLQELAVLVAIADHGSLAVAARRLRRSAPAITRALASLENRIGARLVERTTRKLSLTDAGRLLAERSRALLKEYDAAVGGAADQPVRGLVRVTAPVQFGRQHVAPLVTRFLDAYPEIQVELVLNDRNLDLIEEELDVAVRIGPLSDSSLLARRVGAVTRVVVASPDYLARRGTPMKPADLSAHDTIFNTLRAGAFEWRFGPPQRPTVVRLAPRLLVNEVEAQLIAVRAGHGIARVLSYQVADDLSAGKLTRLLEQHEASPIPVQLVARSGAGMAPKVRAFFDYSAAALSKLRVIRSTV